MGNLPHFAPNSYFSQNATRPRLAAFALRQIRGLSPSSTIQPQPGADSPDYLWRRRVNAIKPRRTGVGDGHDAGVVGRAGQGLPAGQVAQRGP